MKRSISMLAACIFMLPFTLSAQTYVAQSGVSLLTGVTASATHTSGAVRLPNFSGAGTLNITESGITGSPSGCTVALSYQQNNATVKTAAVATISFTPATGTQQIAVAPSTPSGDSYVAVYACSSTYPTAGLINISFSPTQTVTLSNTAGIGDPCQNPAVAKSSAVINVATAGEASLVAPSTGKSIYVCGVSDGSLGTTPSLVLQTGTVAGCASGTTAATGAIPFTAGSVLNLGYGGTIMTVPASGVLCALTVGNGHYGVVSYVQQ